MTDYRRMEWQARANRTADWTRRLAAAMIGADAVLVFEFRWWPWWQFLIAAPMLIAVCLAAEFVYRRTEMYKIDD